MIIFEIFFRAMSLNPKAKKEKNFIVISNLSINLKKYVNEMGEENE